MSTESKFKHSAEDVETVTRYVMRHAECNSFAFESEEILICVSDIVVETGVDRDAVVEILATEKIKDHFLEEEFGQNMYAGPYFFDVLSTDTIVYCTPGSRQIAKYSGQEVKSAR